MEEVKLSSFRHYEKRKTSSLSAFDLAHLEGYKNALLFRLGNRATANRKLRQIELCGSEFPILLVARITKTSPWFIFHVLLWISTLVY
jgi:hypothetical protein